MPVTPGTVAAGLLSQSEPRATMDDVRAWLSGGGSSSDFDEVRRENLPAPAVWPFPRQCCDGELQEAHWNHPDPKWPTVHGSAAADRANLRVVAPTQTIYGAGLGFDKKAPLGQLRKRVTCPKYARIKVDASWSLELSLSAAATYTFGAYFALYYRFDGGAVAEVLGARRALPGSNPGYPVPYRSGGVISPGGTGPGTLDVWLALVAPSASAFDAGTGSSQARVDVSFPNLCLEIFKDVTT